MTKSLRRPASDAVDRLLNPQSIAVVGSLKEARFGGFVTTSHLLRFGYRGKIYPVNTKGEEVRGLKVYRSLQDIPGPVDYVICIIPADATPGLVQDCVAKGVKGLHLYTAGFAETGLAEKSALQADLVRVARGGGVRLNGPNCMGIYHPKMGMTYGPNFPREAGNVAFISQSGSYTLLLVSSALNCAPVRVVLVALGCSRCWRYPRVGRDRDCRLGFIQRSFSGGWCLGLLGQQAI